MFTISNKGTTIPPEDRDKIFERFYRTDQTRNRKTGTLLQEFPDACDRRGNR